MPLPHLSTQNRRIFFNYVRMIFTFFIGLIVIKYTIKFDEKLFVVYSLVTVGLGLGAMVRELSRAAIVPFLTMKTDVKTNLSLRFSQSVTIVVFSVAIYFVLSSFILLIFEPYLKISSEAKDSFKLFFWLRFLGYSFTILSLPIINIFAYRGEMGIYNVWLVVERLADLVALISIYLFVHDKDINLALAYSGSVYLLWCVIQFFVFLWFFKQRKSSSNYRYQPAKLNAHAITYIRDQLAGSVFLVLNMAFYFRLSLILINVIFGETLSIIYAVSVQLSSYLRQAVMGLMAGVDSFFAKKDKQDYKKNFSYILYLSRINLFILLIVSIFLILNIDKIIVFLINEGHEVNLKQTIQLSTLLMTGVLFHSISEPWMQYLNGQGKIIDYSSKILFVSLTTPIAVYLSSLYDYGTFILGVHYIVATGISQLIIVPWILSKEININYFRITSEPFLMISLFLPVVLFSLRN